MAVCAQQRRPLEAVALVWCLCLAGSSRTEDRAGALVRQSQGERKEAAQWTGCPAHFLQEGTKLYWDSGRGHGSVKATFEECPGGSFAAAKPTGASRDRPLVRDADLLLQRMQGGDFDAMRSFKEMRKWSWDGLTFRESWTDKDTEYLRRLDGRPGAWVDGELTTDAVRAVLPTFAELQKLVDRQRIAIVGSGPSAAGKGKEVDLHPVVARFNSFEQYQGLMGNKIDIHALNSAIEPPSEPNVWQVQLEQVFYFEPLCTQLHRQGRFYHPSQQQRLLFVRPSVRCSVPRLGGWSRGFMFYWFMGSMFQSVDLYGMSTSDGRDHASGIGAVYEPFLTFEHQIYRQIYEEGKATGAKHASFLNVTRKNVTRKGRGLATLPAPQHLRFIPQPSWW